MFSEQWNIIHQIQFPTWQWLSGYERCPYTSCSTICCLQPWPKEAVIRQKKQKTFCIIQDGRNILKTVELNYYKTGSCHLTCPMIKKGPRKKRMDKKLHIIGQCTRRADATVYKSMIIETLPITMCWVVKGHNYLQVIHKTSLQERTWGQRQRSDKQTRNR